MFKNYLKISWRSIIRHPFFSVVNISGLALGITFLLLIGSFAYNEYNINKTLDKEGRVYLLTSNWKHPEMGYSFATLGLLTKTIAEEYPALVESYYTHDGVTSVVTVGDKHFRAGLHPGDSTLFEVFDLPVLYGNKNTALQNPDGVVLTASKAKLFFGTSNAVGKTMRIQSFDGKNKDFEVTAVLKDLPFNTLTNYYNPGTEIFLAPASIKYLGREGVFSWKSANAVGYLKLKKGVSPSQLKAPIAQILKTHTSVEVQRNLDAEPVLFSKWYFRKDNGLAKKMVIVFILGALFILIMAIINFVNISVGNSLTRMREIGVRKAMGGVKLQLIIQFMTESLLLVSIALMMAVGFYILLLPYFNQIVGKNIPALTNYPAWFAVIPVAIIFLTGLLAGLYPAFILSSQPSVTALKGRLKTVGERQTVRRVLLAVQFTTAIVVFIAAIVINQQVSFFFQSDLGFQKDRIVTVPVPRDWTVNGVENMKAKRDIFKSLSAVKDASVSFEIPDGGFGGSGQLYRPAADSSTAIAANAICADNRFAEVYGIKMSAGDFYVGGSPDSLKLVINEAAARSMGWNDPKMALNQPVRFFGFPGTFYIKGVTKDFHFGSMKDKIQPLYFTPVEAGLVYRYLSFKLNNGSIADQVAMLQKEWNIVFPQTPFDYKFIDDSIASLYETETRMHKAARLSTVVAFALVALGVLGISAMSITRRTKEVGIRKVLGASYSSIVLLFLKEFSWIIVVSNIIGWPLSWYLLNQWLNGYSYRVSLGIIPFAAVGITVSGLVILIIALMLRRVAATNPIKSLQTE